MALNKVTEGKVFHWVNDTGADVLSGSLVLMGGIAGVALVDVPAGGSGAVDVAGVFELPKDNAAIGQGVPVYWDADGNPVVGTAAGGCMTATADGNRKVGVAYATAEAADAVVQVKINA